MLTDLPHSQYQTEDEGDLVVFRCTECGYVSLSLGGLHGHIESHRDYSLLEVVFPISELPFGKSIGDFDALMDYTEVLRVEDTEEISVDEVEEETLSD